MGFYVFCVCAILQYLRAVLSFEQGLAVMLSESNLFCRV